MKRCIFIIGVHRSGTSAVAGMLAKGGLCLGKDLLEADWVNKNGYFEDTGVLIINDAIYSDCGYSTWFPAGTDVQFVCRHYKDIFCIFLRNYRDIDVCAFKNPKFCATFPVWERYFAEFDIQTDIIFTKRDPCAISDSIQRIRNISKSMADDSVILHLELIEHIKERYPGKILYVADYDKLIKAPKKVYNELRQAIGVKLAPGGYKFIDKTMKHF